MSGLHLQLLFFSNYTGRLIVCPTPTPPHPAQWLLDWAGQVSTGLATELVLDHLLTDVLDHWVTVTVSISFWSESPLRAGCTGLLFRSVLSCKHQLKKGSQEPRNSL